MKPPMPYAGGKQRLARQIVALMPPHHHYVEPFAGALSVLLAKPPSIIETVNDLDSEIATFWRVLRTQTEALERMCALTPHSRAEYMQARHPLQDGTDLEVAWRVWVRLTQGRGSVSSAHAGWRAVHGGNTRTPLSSYLTGYLARMAPAAERLRMVSLECRPGLDVIRAYDQPGTLFYADPPYLGSTRTKGIYQAEMADEDSHRDLLDILKACQGKVILSGYRSQLYDTELANWTRVDLATTAMTGEKRTESLWLNYEPPAPTLEGV